jgi:hypothetical protein
MRAYRKYLTIENPKQVTLSDLPFAPGECVEVVMLAAEPASTAQMEALHLLLQTTQALPHARALTDAEIAAEVAAVRGR